MEINKIHLGNCLELIKQLDSDSIDAIITDPPYELGFMGKKWDSTGIAYNVDLWRECLRVLKPGGHLLAFSGTRTYHRMACAIEDAGFEVRDMLEWIYASGFPKSLNVGKAIDKLQGNERDIVGYTKSNPDFRDADRISKENCGIDKLSFGQVQGVKRQQTPICKGSSKWEGFGTALKPAHEPILMARKPLSEKTIIDNVLKHGTGAIDIDGCRIYIQDIENEPGYRPNAKNHITNKGKNSIFNHGGVVSDNGYFNSLGRFPANILCTDDALNDGVIEKSTNNGGEVFRRTESNAVNTKGMNTIGKSMGERKGYDDIGSKSRYFDIDVWGEKNGLLQFPKASKRDRGDGNTHPTVKPTHLMAWLIKLVSKDGDIILDPFTGSGTTLVAAKTLKRNYIGFEITSEYEQIANNRLNSMIELQPKLF